MKKMFLKILALFFVAFTSAQNIDVSGNVNDTTGLPIPGVNVIVKNTNNKMLWFKRRLHIIIILYLNHVMKVVHCSGIED